MRCDSFNQRVIVDVSDGSNPQVVRAYHNVECPLSSLVELIVDRNHQPHLWILRSRDTPEQAGINQEACDE